jgi:hypothetical protein
MKKKTTTTKRTATQKAPRKTLKKTTNAGQAILIHRIFIVSACVTLFVAGVLIANKQTVNQSVAGASIMRGMFLQAAVPIPDNIAGATSYNIYYRKTGDTEFSNAVRNLSPYVGTYTISHLKKGSTYEYKFSAVDASGKEFFFSEILPLTNVQPMK